jgi:hypothetical protein
MNDARSNDARRRTRIWQRSPRVAAIESPDRVAFVHLDHVAAPPRMLEGSGAVIWSAIDGVSDEDEIIAAVAESFGVERHTIDSDVIRFIDELHAADLILQAGEGTAD